MKIRILAILFALTSFRAMTQAEQPKIEFSVWKGFKKEKFLFEGKDAHVVKPNKTLDGKPWVWRARFPNWHAEMDSILLSEGYHIAHINTENMYGSPKAMAIWDRFYTFLRNEYKLDKKLSLEGASRGGLFIFNWAKNNPDKINCIYAESPVCDFKSWPGGFGHGKGSKEDWERLKIEYGFTSDKEAKLYIDQPFYNLEELAQEKVPILFMVGLKDEVVPMEENTIILADRYVKLGGSVTIVPCTEGEQDLFGHHFPIETPRLGADFIRYNTELPKPKLESSTYHHLRGGLKNSFIKFEREKKGRVAFLGGSITYNGGWRDSITNFLKYRFPNTKFEFIAAGIPSMGSTPAAFRLERDVLENGPVDLLFEEAAVNDAANGRANEEQIRAMEGIVRHVRHNNPTTDIVLMHFVDPEKMESYRNGEIPQVIQNHERVAIHYNIPTIDLAKEVTERIGAGEFSWEEDFKNLHPSPFGQGIYAHSIITFLENAWDGNVAEDDKITVHSLPEKLDNNSYDNGALIPISNNMASKGWKYDANWKPSDGVGSRENYTNVPMLIGSTTGAILKFKFEGTAVGITVAAGPDAGILEYRIDNGPWLKQDLFTNWSSHLHLPWYFTLKTDLMPGKHVLRLRLNKEKNMASKGNSCRIRYFYVNKD
ncbi:SGNH/GDSL hydrolase family protein [Arenibacter certesii]|uniref:SGNH/GDSL hydrolase family protein n=1 Tax=Arenibacter certesii TaxID=228955 RepID=A0A918J5L4_9FLAO|nr:SGNH/GDSL hydrolase family protein [Arenibacter certesii]GGW48317.1 hypothetical protein GCM10007383_35520 [Arenibacter certesii]